MINKENKLRELLYGKSIALIGGAPSIDFDAANQAEFVVWANNHWMRQESPRVDGIYSCCQIPPDIPIRSPEFVCYDIKGPQRRQWESKLAGGLLSVPYVNDRFAGVNPYDPIHEWLNTFGWELMTKPFTGTIALKHLTSMPIKSLLVTGFDFYESGGIIPWKKHNHWLEPQLLYFLQTYKADQRVEFDERLLGVLAGFARGELRYNYDGASRVIRQREERPITETYFEQ